jgi:AraC family transcriptional regulator
LSCIFKARRDNPAGFFDLRLGFVMAPTENASLADSSRTPGFVGGNRPDLEENVTVERPDRRPLYFSRYRQNGVNLGVIEPTPLADQLMVSIELIDRGPTDMFRDQKHVWRPAIRPGALGLFDLRQSWAADVRDPFDNMNVFLPLSTFDEFAEEFGATFDGLDHKVEHDNNDQTMLHLALAMAPALDRPHELNTLFLNHCFLAVRAHLAQTYGVFSRNPARARYGLTYRQKQLALDYMEANLHTDMSLSDIAKACEMSVSSLSRAFKVTMGHPPHQWLMRRRIEKAKQLLITTSESLAGIALACGFFDQSHFTRVFSRIVGANPHTWRR